jgi:hypothetical protein
MAIVDHNGRYTTYRSIAKKNWPLETIDVL